MSRCHRDELEAESGQAGGIRRLPVYQCVSDHPRMGGEHRNEIQGHWIFAFLMLLARWLAIGVPAMGDSHDKEAYTIIV